MKASCGLMMLVFLGLVACFNPPEYPSIPEIEFSSINFVETPDIADADTLNLAISFKDGDGDIGLLADQNLDELKFAERFYRKVNVDSLFILRNGGTSLDILNRAVKLDLEKKPSFIRYSTKRKNPQYDTLPSFIKPYDCTNWEIVYKTVNNTTSVVDTLYFQLNPNHYNIFVDFLVLKNDGSGDFEEFDFRKEFCVTYDGRIPVLAKEAGQQAPLQGIIHYSMIGTGFKLVFSKTPIKLRIQIMDRALNRSNIITSNPFVLDDI